MTRKDYEAIASAIVASDLGVKTQKKVVAALSVVLLRDNRRFDKARFAKTCAGGK